MELVSTPPQSVIRPRKRRATPGACGWARPAASRGSSTSLSVRDLPRRARHQARARRVAGAHDPGSLGNVATLGPAWPGTQVASAHPLGIVRRCPSCSCCMLVMPRRSESLSWRTVPTSLPRCLTVATSSSTSSPNGTTHCLLSRRPASVLSTCWSPRMVRSGPVQPVPLRGRHCRTGLPGRAARRLPGVATAAVQEVCRLAAARHGDAHTPGGYHPRECRVPEGPGQGRFCPGRPSRPGPPWRQARHLVSAREHSCRRPGCDVAACVSALTPN